MKNEFKEQGTYYHRGPKLKDDGSTLRGAVRKALAEHQRLLQGPQARTAHQGGRYAQSLGGRRSTTLQDGTIITTWVNPFGLHSTLQASVIVPGVEEEEIVEEQLIRGLIGLPNAAYYNSGWGIPFTEENRPLGTPVTRGWDACIDGNPSFFGIPFGEGTENPKRETILPASGIESYLPNSRGLGGFDGMLYENINWIGTMPDDYDQESSEPPDVIVLSWKSYAGRYAEIPPSAGQLFYRGDALCGLPPAVDPVTYLGAAVAEHDGVKWLVAAISAKVDGRKLEATAFNWPEMWSAYRFGKPVASCDPDWNVPHLHYPVQFWRRKWNESYQNDLEYDADSNPSGWIHIEDVECQSYTSLDYTRAYETTRPLAGVYFSPDGLKAACTFVDEWTDPEEDETQKNVHNITGYFVWDVGLDAITQTVEHVNPEQGTTHTWAQETRSATLFDDWENDCGGGPPFDTGCDDTFVQAGSRNASYNTSTQSGGQTTYNPKIVAVDFDSEGTLVTATMSCPGVSADPLFSTDVSSTAHSQSLTQTLFCDASDPNYTNILGQVLTQTWSFSQNSQSKGNEEYTFTVSGDSGFSLTFYEKKSGRERSSAQSGGWENITNNEDVSPWNDCGAEHEQISSPYGAEAITGNKIENITERIWDIYGTGSFKAVWFYHLDLRSGTAGYLRYDRDAAIIDTFSASGGWSNNDWEGTQTTTRTYTNHAILYLEVIEQGVTTTLASGVTEDLSPFGDNTVSSGPWNPGTWTLAGTSQPDPGTDTSTSEDSGGWPIEERPGIRGFFPVSAYAEFGIDWVIEGVFTDWGTADEWGNLLVGFEDPHIQVIDSTQVQVTYFLNDIADPRNITHLSGTDFIPIFDLESYEDQSVTQIGLI